MRKILIPTQGDFVAPRFDLATEVLIATVKDRQLLEQPKSIIMERPSEEELCQIIIGEKITEIACGGIDEIHYNFLSWKKITIYDSVIGDWQTILKMVIDEEISHKTIIFPNKNNELTL